MNAAYVDTSCLAALLLGEAGGPEVATSLRRFSSLHASPLLEAELRSLLHRESVAAEPRALGWLSWVLPDRPLTAEIRRTLASGYLRGADLQHVATALFLSPDPTELAFLTLDHHQRRVAAELGFRVDTESPLSINEPSGAYGGSS